MKIEFKYFVVCFVLLLSAYILLKFKSGILTDVEKRLQIAHDKYSIKHADTTRASARISRFEFANRLYHMPWL